MPEHESKNSAKIRGAPLRGSPPEGLIPVLAHLSGSRRGATEILAGDVARIGTAANAEIHFPADRESSVSARHATLRRRGHTYELEVEREQMIWVNGQRVNARMLDSGDVLQIGPGGPLLRFRLHHRRVPAYKSMRQIFSDCLDCARYGGQTRFGRVRTFLSAAPRDLATQTSPGSRWGLAALMLLFAASTIALTIYNVQLERRLQAEQARVDGIAELLRRGDSAALTPADLDAVRAQTETRLSDTLERLDALEARFAAGKRAISAAAGAIILLQGAYSFVEKASGKPLRYAGLGPDGNPLRSPSGEPFVSTEGEGPVVESVFTGTAFVASNDGLLLTNRHVARPWEFDEAAQQVAKQGFRPVLRRFVGYLPGVRESFDVELVRVSDTADLAVLRCSGVTGRVRPLKLSTARAEPGDEVIVMGYPTGIRALLARADKAFVDRLRSDGDLDAWAVARRLSAEGRVAPLATRGIVGQVSSAAVVYDAETAGGGSGGPVLGLDGEVIAINTGIMPGFGGSNLGVPAEQARRLLAMGPARSS